ncbi:MAG: protein kinase [Pyrinomonadaceae bacterium]
MPAMKADRWRYVEKLYDAAVELRGTERARFVDEVCAEDEELRRELLSLLEAEQKVGNFLESPALEVAAKVAADEHSHVRPSAIIGQEFGAYRIERLLGVGGMGQVFLAFDAKLNRQVALKILPPQLVSDPAHVKRFEREAQAISALNHPNLVTIYDVGEANGVNFIATEFIAGQTVRELIDAGLKLNTALAIATQVAEGLSAAHSAGVLHRDIKPENIMVRPDGYVKVLDFGLAKLSDPSSDTQPSRRSQTEPGSLMGTLAYMSPEQAAGDEVDQRSDVWSLGVVLYEMMTGGSPTQGANRLETLATILSNDPLPALALHPAVLPEIDHIVGKALEKDRELRYQTASDLRADLRRLKRELDSSPSHSDSSGRRMSLNRNDFASPKRWSRKRVLVLGAAVVLAILAGAWLIGARFWKKAPSGPNWSRASNLQLTIKAGSELFCSLAPDGRSFVYVGNDEGNTDIFLQRVGGKNSTNLTKDSAGNETTPAFSPDGNLIAFYSNREPSGLYLMEATGENQRRISDIGFHPSWSPDGKEIVVGAEWIGVHANKSIIPSALWIVNVASGDKRLLTKGDAAQPSWSPGGSRIVYWHWSSQGRGDIATIPATGGPAVSVTTDDATDWNPVWSPDGHFIYFTSNRGGSMNFWRIAVDENTGKPLGTPEAVPTPSNYAFNISFSRDGKSMIYVRYESTANLQTIAFDPVAGKASGEPVWITRGYTGVSTPQLSPDGERYIIRWPRWTQEDIAICNKDGSNWRALTDDKFQDRHPRWFPDSKRIAFTSDRSGLNQIWAINADGTGLTQLTFAGEGGATSPVLSPDGSRLAFLQLKSIGGAIFLLDLTKTWTEQTPVELPPVTALTGYFNPTDWSPDGETLIGNFFNDELRGAGLGTFAFASGRYLKLSDSGSYPRWLNDGRRFLFYQKNSVYLGDTEGAVSRPIYTPASYQIQDPALSADNRTIYFRYLQIEADVWLLSQND